jgi:GT2 family glycosyltransferase
VPFSPAFDWPRVSVLVCSHNGASTLRECLAGVGALDYPDFETIVVDDGSTDATAAIAEEFDVRVIRTPNRGLAAARNTALDAASGEIVAYIDDDASPDPHWLQYAASTLLATPHAGCGGPNIPPPDSRRTAEAVACAPGGPTHVLLSDAEAEHIPGCNMAFWRRRLQAIGGFDEQFRVAGDDVDISWRLQQRGWTLGFNAGAVVWHRRRGSVRAFLRQQYEYGKAEALLERKWPDRYNGGGHLTWVGRVYGTGSPRPWRGRRWRVYYGTWGSGPFQPLELQDTGMLSSLAAMPESYLAIAGLAAFSALGSLWRPLLLALPLLVVSAVLLVVQAGLAAARAQADRPWSHATPALLRVLTIILHLAQPLARLAGRLRHGLAPWRRPCGGPSAFPRIGSASTWSEVWRRPESWLEVVEALLLAKRVPTLRGGVYDRWDLQARGGLLGACRVRSAVEDHSAGKQLLRFRFWPKPSLAGIATVLVLGLIAVLAAVDGTWAAFAGLAAAAVTVAGWMASDCAIAMGAVVTVLRCDLEEASEPGVVRPSEPRTSTGAEWSVNADARREQEAVT